MSLATGARLGPYEITAPIGAGGMGEVYRARDTRLGREVAIKILPEAFATDPERLARFRREAQVLASLNHPNIAIIHGLEDADGTRALVMELVEGPTLADRIARGAIALDEALRIATQIAEALEAAHEQGIIHRDLKPANIKVRDDGTVKVLDFGLAKAIEPGSGIGQGSAGVSQSPTITTPALPFDYRSGHPEQRRGVMTGVGVLLGTAAYMSPEQAKGRPADKRSDIWAFGCVLYEMLTGRRAFDGGDVTDTIARILRDDPQWSALPATTPSGVHRLLRRCLRKNLADRLPHIGVARLELSEAPSPLADGAADRRPGRRESLAWAIAAVLAILSIGVAVWATLLRAPVDRSVYRLSVTLPENALMTTPVAQARLALSPDGRHLAFVAGTTERSLRLWLRRLDDLEPRPLPGTEGATSPFWSPDSRYVAFVAGGFLKKVDLEGGASVTLAPAEVQGAGTWNESGDIVFSAQARAALVRVRDAGGPPVPVTTLEPDEVAHTDPFFLPDGHHFLYTARYGGGPEAPLKLYLGSLDGARTHLLDDVANAMYSDGHLLFVRDTTLMAQPFDESSLTLGGPARPVATDVAVGGNTGRHGAFSTSATGVLAYQNSVVEGALSQLTWFERSGTQGEAVGDPADYFDVELSPDDTRAAVSIRDRSRRTYDVWTVDLRRGIAQRLTSQPGNEQYPLWSPDGRRIAFSTLQDGRYGVFERPASGMGVQLPVLTDDVPRLLGHWSQDGRFLFGIGGGDLWVMTLDNEQKQPDVLTDTPFAEGGPRLSPDGRWLAYTSNEAGEVEIYVARFPGLDETWRISRGGGRVPRWRGDGREIFYEAPGGRIMAATVRVSGQTLEVGAIAELFQANIAATLGRSFDVTGDGQRFLVNVAAREASAPLITILIDWPALLR